MNSDSPTARYSASADTQEKEDRYPIDRMLRSHGFEIVSRPKDGTPLWKRGGILYTERDAWELRKAEVLSVETRRGG